MGRQCSCAVDGVTGVHCDRPVRCVSPPLPASAQHKCYAVSRQHEVGAAPSEMSELALKSY